jgi:hypothetical protein
MVEIILNMSNREYYPHGVIICGNECRKLMALAKLICILSGTAGRGRKTQESKERIVKVV